MTAPARNIVLTGFMGTGKSAVGRALADLLGRPFRDLDEVVAAEAGRSVADLFAAEGEAGFRDRERRTAAALAAPAGLVIATGGGTLLDPDSRAALAAGGQLVLLTADTDELAARLAVDAEQRPLLAGHADLSARIAELLTARADLYRGCDLELDTTDLDPAAAALALAAHIDLPLADLAIPVPGAAGLPVLAARDLAGTRVVTGRGAACRLGAELTALGVTGRVVVALPPVIREHYLPRLAASLDAAGLGWDVLDVRDGDSEKTFDQVAELTERLTDLGCDRGTCLVAAGGGVTGDLAGFTAAVYMRGIALAMVPTTLLAMVDAHIGGKTGVNSKRAKNMAGAFHPPLLVAADPCLLATLPDRELAGGLAEVVKTALIGDPVLYGRLEHDLVLAPTDTEGDRDARRDPDLLEACVVACAAVKAGVVTRDPWELGERRVLNLGHTVGHALEAQSAYGLSHGEAVSLGLLVALNLAVERGAADPELLVRTRRLLEACGLPVRPPEYDADDLRRRLRLDKKNRDGHLRFIVPRAPGDVVVADDVEFDEALEALARERACESS